MSSAGILCCCRWLQKYLSSRWLDRSHFLVVWTGEVLRETGTFSMPGVGQQRHQHGSSIDPALSWIAPSFSAVYRDGSSGTGGQWARCLLEYLAQSRIGPSQWRHPSTYLWSPRICASCHEAQYSATTRGGFRAACLSFSRSSKGVLIQHHSVGTICWLAPYADCGGSTTMMDG